MATIEDIPEDFLTLIGCIVFKFNLLDNSLMGIIIELMGQNSNCLELHAPYAQMQFKTRKTLLDLLVKSREFGSVGTPLETYRRDLLRAIDKVADRRNAITHSVWGVEDGVVYRRRLRATKRVHIEKVAVNKVDLEQLLEEIDRCRSELSPLYFYAMQMRAMPQQGQK